MNSKHTPRFDRRWTWSAITLACILTLSGALGFAGEGQNAKQRRTTKTPATPARPAPETPAVVPFATGEKLAFRVLWSKYAVTAGEVNLSVVERRDFFGRMAWHFQAIAHSLDTIRILYALDDQFDSYTDAVRLTSMQYEMYLHEQGKQQNNVWRMGAGDDPAPAPAGVVVAKVLTGTCDPIGVLYALRAADWKNMPELHTSVFDGHELYEIDAKADPSASSVTVPAGQFSASRIDVRVAQHGQQLNDFHFSLWLAQDAARTPVLIEAEIPLGTARIELTAH